MIKDTKEKTKISKNFGKTLKRVRGDVGMSQNDLCKKLQVDRSYISSIENGKQNPTIETAAKIAKALGVSLKTLMIKTAKMKRVGIIGGMGPDTTAEFYLAIINSKKLKDAHTRPDILIASVPLPLSVENDFILFGEREDEYLPFLIEAAQKLEKAGAEFLVMPCNSMHVFITEIREVVNIPVLSIIEETVRFIHWQKLKRVGVLSTSGTLKNQLYENALARAGIEFNSPDEFQQEKLGKYIHNLVNGCYSNSDRKGLMEIIDSFKDRGVKHVALACTDLQLLLPSTPDLVVFDTMRVLVDATVDKIIG